MLGKWFTRARRATGPATARTAPGDALYAVGDVHGRDDLLEALLAAIARDADARRLPNVTVIFLGDLIDRGGASSAVLERCMALPGGRLRPIFLLGNHEQILLDAWDGSRPILPLFHRAGGRETLASYGVDPADYDRWDFEELSAQVRRRVPRRHIDFVRSFGLHHRSGDYLFVHAGIRPGVAIEDQRREDLLWIRQDFTDFGGDHGVVVVHGHSRRRRVEERANRIGIDTGAYESGTLTAVGLHEGRRWFLSTGGDI